MLDADNLPLINPSRLYEQPGLGAHGNMFWPDLFQREGLSIVPDKVYLMFNLTPPWKADPGLYHTESGQYVMDRSVRKNTSQCPCWGCLLHLDLQC